MAINRVRRLVGNFASLLTSEVVNRATIFVLYAMVARYLGAFEFGQLSLALSLFFITQVLAGVGLKTLVTREVAKDRTKTGLYLVNGSAIVAVGSLLATTALLFFVRLANYSPGTASIILLLSLGLLPFSLSVINKAVFQAWERMHYIAWANVPVNVAKVGMAFLLLRQGHGLFELILLLLACCVAILGIEWWLMLRHLCFPLVVSAMRTAHSLSLSMEGRAFGLHRHRTYMREVAFNRRNIVAVSLLAFTVLLVIWYGFLQG